MNYKAYKLNFTGNVHFGKRTLESANMTFTADRLFAALAFEAVHESDEAFSEFINLIAKGKIIFSDAFPFMGNEYYCPKPMIKVATKTNDEDIKKRKQFKKLEYLPISKFGEYVLGKAEIEELLPPEPGFGKFAVKTSVSIEPLNDPKPYRVGYFAFNKNSGLYILAGYEEKSSLGVIEDLLDRLSFSGIGGKRSAGLGKFELDFGEFPQEGLDRLNGVYENYMTLSSALPKDEEMEKALKGARYLLEKKSGFAASIDYAPEWRRKRDSFAFIAGSVFKNKWQGVLKDVSQNGNHPVYRCLMPIFMGVD